MTETIETIKPEVIKPYTFRTLGAVDMMPMFRIIGKIGINEFSKCFNSDMIKSLMGKKDPEDQADLVESVGMKIFLDAANIIITHLPDCEEDIFKLLANVSGLTIKDVKAFDFVPFTRMLIDFVKKDEFKDFIGVVSELFN